MGGPLEAQAFAVPANDALAQALAALTAGRHDPRLADGAQANALESIAWSLIGILSKQTASTPQASTEERSLSDELRSRGFLQIDPQPR